MDDENIFRKVAMERLSSPENLDQVMRVVPAKGWIALVCLFVFAVVLGYWACSAGIARQVEGRGVLARNAEAAEVIALFAAEDASKIQPKMAAVVALDSGEEFAGVVESVQRTDETESIVRIRLNGEAEAVPSAGDAAELPCTVRVTIESIAPIRLMLSGG